MYTYPLTHNNKSLSIYIENSFENLLIHELNVGKTILDSLNIVEEFFVVSSLIASALVGSYFKIPLYHYMYDRFKGSSNGPIDVLILINGIIQHFVCILLAIVVSIGLLFNITFSHHLGESWCNIPWYAGVFGMSYRTMGSLGISIFRLLHIKCSDWIKFRFGQVKTLCMILTMSITTSIGLSFAFGMGNGPASRKQATWNWCIGRNEEFRETEHNYNLLIGKVSQNSDLIATTSILVLFTGTIVELLSYVVLFSHLHSHDNDMLSRKRVSEGEIKRRRQKNAVTFLGQFYGFVVECISYLGFLYTFKESSDVSLRVALAIGFWVEFGIASIVEVMTSKNLRRYLPHH